MVRSAWSTIGVSADQRIDAVKNGLSIQHLHQFFEVTKLPAEAVLKVLRITEQDLGSRQELSPEESERLWRLAAVYVSSLALFEGDKDQTYQWLCTPQRAIGQVAPLEHIITEPGAAEVQDLIARIEHGVLV